MRSAMKKTSLREIKSTFGRFFAIMAIIALGVGFFTGVRITTPAMVNTVNIFLEDNQFYDYRLLSTLGWNDDDVEFFSSQPDVRYAEGAYSLDVIYNRSVKRDYVMRTHSLPKDINRIELEQGRLPQAENECVVDSKCTNIEIGSVFYLSDSNTSAAADMLSCDRFTVVGTVKSPYYINFERGTTSIGNGTLDGFIYVMPEVFNAGYYSELFVRFDQDYEIYSDEYDDYMSGMSSLWETLAQERADRRYETLYNEADNEIQQGRAELDEKTADARSQLDSAKSELDSAKEALDAQYAQLEAIKDIMPDDYAQGMEQYNAAYIEYESGLADYETSLEELEVSEEEAEKELAEAEEELAKLKMPDTYVLGRNTNIGYACFESDSEIVQQVARVFPIFFILVAALVCMTTMSRMVEEQRTQIGVFKALGYSQTSIMGKYMFYSGSAALSGCIIGYVVGTYLFPKIIWMTYELMYIPLPIPYLFDEKLAAIALAVSLICSIGVTWLTCRVELSGSAAGLMRPKAPKAGKRVLLERFPLIWNRLKFLYKVSIRNVFRYKKRFFMMIAGISGCTALLVTGFGLKDSIAGFAASQYDEIQKADADVLFKTAETDRVRELLEEKDIDHVLLQGSQWDLIYGERVKGITLEAPESYEGMASFMQFISMDGQPLDYPRTGEALVSHSVSQRYGVSVGDEITLRNEEMQELHFTVSGVFRNHVYNYVFVNASDILGQCPDAYGLNEAYVNFPEGADVYQDSAELSKNSCVTSVTIFQELKERLAKMMSSLDYIVLIVIISAAGLAFIVIYDLTNINITERIREIATIKVLGFFRRETSAYVLRENIALTAIGTALGLLLGILLHRFVMKQIVVDLVDFSVRILPQSFLYSVILTFVFNAVVNAFMKIKLERINMAESLKSID